MTSSEFSAEADAAMKEMINLQTSLEFKKILGNIILSFTTLAIAIVPPFLAYTNGSFLLLFLWLIYPAVIVIQQSFRSSKEKNFFIWTCAHYATWHIIYSISSAPSWFFWVYIGLASGNHIFFVELAVISNKIRNLSETDGWKEIESRNLSNESK